MNYNGGGGDGYGKKESGGAGVDDGGTGCEKGGRNCAYAAVL